MIPYREYVSMSGTEIAARRRAEVSRFGRFLDWVSRRIDDLRERDGNRLYPRRTREELADRMLAEFGKNGITRI